MDIYSFYDVVNHLPRKYDDYTLTNETNLIDKQRVVLFGKIASTPKLVRARNIFIVTFDFITSQKHYFKVVAFNRKYLVSVLEANEEYTIIGNYNKKDNEINFINFNKGRIAPEECLKPIYQLPSEYPNYSFHLNDIVYGISPSPNM